MGSRNPIQLYRMRQILAAEGIEAIADGFDDARPVERPFRASLLRASDPVVEVNGA